MRDSRIRLTTLVALALASVISSCLWADDPKSIWPTYHADMLRRGINQRSLDISNPASLNLIWVFPRATEDVVQEDYLYVVDNRDPLFTLAGDWRAGYDPEAWGYSTAVGAAEAAPYSYLWAPAVNSDDASKAGFSGPKARAVWHFPTAIPKGYYQVWVWVPPGPPVDLGIPNSPAYTYTTAAQYTVYHGQGQATVTFDQTQGGTWQLLSVDPYPFVGAGDLRVELTNLTPDSAAAIALSDIRVAADAIKFVPVTGQEIYSSPTSAEIDFNWISSTKAGLKWSGRIPVVYTGTVEPSLTGSGRSQDTGAIYCINSITPDTQAYDYLNPSDDLHKELSNLLGTPLWRYPRDLESMTTQQAAKFLAEPNAGLEGPIQGGIYSSITLAHVPPLLSIGQDQFIAVATAMDRQVYGLDAQTGKLLWKGPGVTLSEVDKWTTEPDPTSGKLRNDAFGGQYHWTQCGVGTEMVWDFSKMLANTGALGPNRSYSVYVWIPVAKGAETAFKRITDALYTVTYDNGKTAKITSVNQSSAANQGSWVKLGSWFAVQSVSLSTSRSNGAGANDPVDSCVVADAAMVVPDTIGAFGYCTAATDVSQSPDQMYQQSDSDGGFRATSLFASTAAAGRLVCFDLQKSLSNAANGYPVGYVKWVYPSIRNTNVITDPNTNKGGDQPDMGQIGASPTFYDGQRDKMVYMPTLGGVIHCVKADTGDLLGTFTGPSPASTTPNPAPGELTNTVGFTSSATIGQTDHGDKCLFIGSVDGTFYALNPEPDTANKKLLPTTTYQPGTPYGAFRFSTPSTVNKTNSDARVWAPSTDGHIYALRANGPAFNGFLNRIPDSTAMPGFTEPSVLAPIQSSPAFDGYGSLSGKDSITMYVGDMNGILHWFDAMTGQSNWYFDPSLLDPTEASGEENFTGFQCDGALFSSPNVTCFRDPSRSNGTISYIYTGCSDGRVYAFSQYGGAWGGYWAGGRWPLRGGGANRPRSRGTTRLAPDTDVQVDLFNLPYYNLSVSKDPNPMDPTGAYHLGAPWTDDWAVSTTMKMPTQDFPNDGTRNAAIDKYLTTEAQKRRKDPYIYPTLNVRTTEEPIYFEWGETLNVVIWNLPALEFISGSTMQSAASSIVFSLANTSPGASSGTLIHQSSRVTLKEYVVLDHSKPVVDADKKPITNAYEPLRYRRLTEVKRCYAVAQIYLDPKRNPPFSPGPGWTLVVEVKRKRTNDADAPMITQRIPIAKLVPSKDGLNLPDFDHEQQFGVNNPLAISDDQADIGAGANTSIAWPNLLLANSYSAANARNNPEAHFNGNAAVDAVTGYSAGAMPFVNYQFVNHGSSSREARLFVMDRSAVGTRVTATIAGSPVTAKIDNFRIDGGDLLWRGGSDQINGSEGCWLPWEFGPGTADYPNLYRQRQEWRKASDDGLPVDGNTTLPPVFGGIDIAHGETIGRYEDSTMQPETVFASVDVPRFQPANCNRILSNPNNGPQLLDYSGKGYTRTFNAYIDSNGDGNLDTGNQVLGAPTVMQECYRQIAGGAMVPPDPKVEVDESLVDEGIAPHALGEQMVGNRGFSAYNPSPEIQQWFKPVTIKNAGNVNLPNMQIGRYVRLFGDQTSPTTPIPPFEITSSLDWNDVFNPVSPGSGSQIFKSEPFITQGFGYTLSKARVGEPDPTQMSVPDRRKWDLNFGGSRVAAQSIIGQVNQLVNGAPGTADDPLPVRVAVKIPLTQPIGTYQSRDETFNLPYVPVFSDRNGDGKLDVNTEPVAQKSFQLKVTVKETQLTGGQTPTGLVQIDPNGSPRFGEGTPAAYRDPFTGNVLLVYSSNAVVSPAAAAGLSDAAKANAPWMLFHALLGWDQDQKYWKTTGEQPMNRWWLTPPWDDSKQSPFVYAQGWPDTLLGIYVGWNKLTWSGAGTTLPSVRHYSPVFATYDTTVNGNNVRKALLVWVGAIDIRDPDPASSKVAQEYRLFYTDATGCTVPTSAAGTLTIDHDPAMVKRYPSAAFDTSTNRLWIAWQGGEEGKWGLYCTVNGDPANANGWKPDMKLMTPDCLASVSSPNVILRPLWSDDLQVIYAGTTKLGQTSDIMLTRYSPVSQIDVDNETDPAKKSSLIDRLPSNAALWMPRVLDEKLERDSRYGFYTSKHLAWMRPNPGETPKVDPWGVIDLPGNQYAPDDYPVIHVVLPVGYPVPLGCPLPSSVVSGGKTTEQIAVSGTDGSVWHRASDNADWARLSPALVPPAAPAVTMDVDDASGLYVYKYPSDSVAAAILGQMLVDYSAGIVRVTNTLSEQRSDDKFLSAEVWADYTPRTWRLTTDKAADSSPRAFLEKTQMSCRTSPNPLFPDPNPGLGAKWRTGDGTLPRDANQPVDRLWVFWRKAATGAQSSTIYFATYRAGFDLVDLFKRNHVKVDPKATYQITDITGPAGPWEIDGGKTKVFVTTGGGSGAVVIHYQWTDSNGTVHADSVPAAGYGWIPEFKEQSLLGFAADGNVNEGSIYAFADPVEGGTLDPAKSSKIWLFWTSTRAGTANLFWETFCPDFAAR